MAVCYNRYFPEVMRGLAVGGADVVIVPQAGTLGEWPAGLYEAEMRVAAFQSGYFVALCNRAGQEGALDSAGGSFVCGPDGAVVGRAAAGTEQTLVADLDLTADERSHARRLFLRHRRPDLYPGGLGPSPPPRVKIPDAPAQRRPALGPSAAAPGSASTWGHPCP